ncbi:MAG: hypothetical protein E7324_02295 [Clostridiales bacterium]|nr:hypothetical protein [Clostridiales bacterium]
MSTTAQFFRHLSQSARRYDWGKLRWRNLDKTKLVWPFRIMCHPIAGMNELKYEGRGSLAIANGLLIGMLIINCLQYTLQGFAFNTNKLTNFSLVSQLASSSLLVVLFSICGWASGALLDGEGKFREIYIAACYAITPQILMGAVSLVLSQSLVLEEAVFLTLVDGIRLLWTAVALVIGFMTVQQFTVKKTLGALLLTAFFMAAILFLSVLFFSMLQQLFAFLASVFTEINSRR